MLAWASLIPRIGKSLRGFSRRWEVAATDRTFEIHAVLGSNFLMQRRAPPASEARRLHHSMLSDSAAPA